jgi:putative heme-binding domain-containing protein
MKRIRSRTALLGLGACLLGAGAILAVVLLVQFWRPEEQVSGGPFPEAPPAHPGEAPTRVLWTTSRITGSPDPPHPYRIERVFPKLTFTNPLLITGAPGTRRLFVGEHAGKIYSFKGDPACAKADLFLDLTTELHSWDKAGRVKRVGALYGLTFHPRFAQNRYCYVCYVLDSKKDGEQLPDGSRVSRFRVTDTDPPRCDPKSEKVLITWLAGGHNGGDLKFGHDGCLYISTGDGSNPNPPDALDTGQDLGDLLSSVLRIDVDREDKGKAYAVPPDNPFVKTPEARPEIWAYGFRNPWRMSFDRATGDLWVGDVGWELWEMVYRVRRGGNYGWSVMEGRQPVRPESRRGPTPILPPTLDFPHTEAASITGGYVYRGKRLKGLAGAYLCGDWVTRKVWGTRFDGDRITWHKELAQGTQRIVAFGEDHDGEVYFLDYDEKGAVYQLAPNPEANAKRPPFPTRLSETGLFASVKDHTPAPGVVPFAVSAGQWADHATAERFVGLPGKAAVKMYDRPVPIPGGFFSGQVFFPKDGVLARTVFLETERGNSRSRRRLETQVLHFDGNAWRGYTYAWNDDQTDATLVPAAGMDRTFTVTDPKAPSPLPSPPEGERVRVRGRRKQHWHFPSRAECLTCHNPWAGYALAFTLPQLNRDQGSDGGAGNQLQALKDAGLIELLHHDEGSGKATPLRDFPRVRLTDPYNLAADLDERARSYLHVNCSHCHQFGAGGTADLELRYGIPLERTKTLGARPVQGTFEIPGAHILSPGDPFRSVLYYRMAKLGRGRMPHIGSEIVDERGLRLIHDWIRQLPGHKEERALLDKLRALDKPAVSASGRAEAIGQLLSSTRSALMLARALAEDRVPPSLRPQVLAAAMALPNPQVRDLFERFVPDDQRVKRLGSVVRPEQILALKGDVGRGRELFFKSAGLQCVNCHRVAGTGSTLGPDLSQIARKSSRAQILESILEPSKSIDPKYVCYLVETTTGLVHTGLLAERNDREVVLKTVGDKVVRIPAREVARLVPRQQSLMPELLLRDLTAEQAADLLEFLASLK